MYFQQKLKFQTLFLFVLLSTTVNCSLYKSQGRKLLEENSDSIISTGSFSLSFIQLTESSYCQVLSQSPQESTWQELPIDKDGSQKMYQHTIESAHYLHLIEKKSDSNQFISCSQKYETLQDLASDTENFQQKMSRAIYEVSQKL